MGVVFIADSRDMQITILLFTRIFFHWFSFQQQTLHTLKKKIKCTPAKPALLIKFKLELYEFARIFLYIYIDYKQTTHLNVRLDFYMRLANAIFLYILFFYMDIVRQMLSVCVCHNNRIFIYPRALPIDNFPRAQNMTYLIDSCIPEVLFVPSILSLTERVFHLDTGRTSFNNARFCTYREKKRKTL